MLPQRYFDSLEMPPHQHDAWRFIRAHQESYPDGLDVAPWRRPLKPDKLAKLAVAELTPFGKRPDADGSGWILQYCDGGVTEVTQLDSGDSAARDFAAALLTQAHRGRSILWPEGTQRDFRTIFKAFGPWLIQQGYVIDIIGTTSHIKGLRIRRNRQTWKLLDAASVTGVPILELRRQNRPKTRGRAIPETSVSRLWSTIDAMQREIQERFGVSFGSTIGETAVRAASYFLPDGAWCWRPTPLMISLLRNGGGYRGAHIQSRTYRGPSWQVDVRRMYTAMLAEPLPLRVCFAPFDKTDERGAGVWMCDLDGHGANPVYVSVWSGDADGFVPQLWFGGPATVVLTTPEILALRKLGFSVRPGYGFRCFRTFDLRAYVRKLQSLTDAYGVKSAIGLMCKALGNQVWGKWAASPKRWDICYALERPDADWLPYADGLHEIEYLWTRKVVKYRYTQHIELAAMITGAGRALLYTTLSKLLRRGFKVPKIHTDCIWIEGIPPPWTDKLPGRKFGTWRFIGYEPDAVLLRSNAYVWDGVAYRPGSHQTSVKTILDLYDKEATDDTAGGLIGQPWLRAS